MKNEYGVDEEILEQFESGDYIVTVFKNGRVAMLNWKYFVEKP